MTFPDLGPAPNPLQAARMLLLMGERDYGVVFLNYTQANVSSEQHDALLRLFQARQVVADLGKEDAVMRWWAADGPADGVDVRWLAAAALVGLPEEEVVAVVRDGAEPVDLEPHLLVAALAWGGRSSY